MLSPATYNRRVALAIMCPITSHAKGYPFEVVLPSDCAVAGVVLAVHVKPLDWRARHATFECALPPATVDDVLAKLLTLLE